MKSSFFDGLKLPLLVPHAAGRRLRPGNTIEAIDASTAACDAKVQEIDFQITRDAKLVCHHDPTVRLPSGERRAIAALDLKELQRIDVGHWFDPNGDGTFPFRHHGIRIPLVEDVLKRYCGLRFIGEAKPELREAAAILADVVKRSGAVERCCVGSADGATARRIFAELPDSPAYPPLDEALAWFERLHAGVKRPDMSRYELLAVPYVMAGEEVGQVPSQYLGLPVVTGALLGAAHADGLKVGAWLIDGPERAEEACRLGLDALIIDDPTQFTGIVGAETVP